MEKSSSRTTPLIVFKTPALTETSTGGLGGDVTFSHLLGFDRSTKHLQLLTVGTGKKRNFDNGFVFKVKHTQQQRSLYERIHGYLAKDKK